MTATSDEVLGTADEAGRAAATWLRAVIGELRVGLEERPRLGWRSLTYHHPRAGYVVGVFPRQGHAMLVVEHGAALDGFDDLFDGGGRQVRTVVVTAVPDARRSRIEDVVLAAIAARSETSGRSVPSPAVPCPARVRGSSVSDTKVAQR